MANLNVNTVLWNATTLAQPETETMHGEEIDSLAIYHWINFIVISIIGIVGLMLMNQSCHLIAPIHRLLVGELAVTKHPFALAGMPPERYLKGLISQLVVISVLTSIKTKTSTDVFLLALSILDILVILTVYVTENGSIYKHVLKSGGRQIINAGYISVIAHPLEYMVHSASTWCICLMSFDRYLSVCHPIRARSWCTPRKAKLQLLVLVCTAVIYSIPRFIEYYTVLTELEHSLSSSCETDLHHSEGSLRANMYYIWGYTFSSYLLIMYIIPLCLLSFTNYHLIKIIRSRKCFHRNRNNSENKDTDSQMDIGRTTRQDRNNLVRGGCCLPAAFSRPSQSHTKVAPINSQSIESTSHRYLNIEPTNNMTAPAAQEIGGSEDQYEEDQCVNEPETGVSKAGIGEANSTIAGIVNHGFENDIDSCIIVHQAVVVPIEQIPAKNSHAKIGEQPSSTSNSCQVDHNTEKSNNKGVSFANANNTALPETRAASFQRTLKSQTVNRDGYITQQYNQVIRMLITVTVVFSICQIPDMISQLISRLYAGWIPSEELTIVAADFVIINSSINLFIYTITSQRFKNQLLTKIRCLRGYKTAAHARQRTVDQS